MAGYNTHLEQPPGTKREEEDPTAKSNTLVKNTIGTFLVLVLTTVVWFFVDYRNRDTAPAPPVSHLPSGGPQQYGRELGGYILGWAGASPEAPVLLLKS